MLSLALTTLLAFQNASASPGVSEGSQPSDPQSQPAPAATPTPRPGKSPTARPKVSPTPTPKASADLLYVVNKSDASLSLLDAATGKVRTIAPIERGSHEV